jgi:short-subunit dehydrogenase
MDLKGKAVVITGANRGIGWALAKEAASKQALLCLVVRDSSSIDELKQKELMQRGASAVEIFTADLSELSQIEDLAEKITQFHAPSVLINNAGLLTAGLLENQDSHKILELIDVNISALTLLTKSFLAVFLRQGFGKIVNNASVVGEMHFPSTSVYAASKAYVIAFTEALRQEIRGTGVSTLIMHTPGVKTDLFDEIHDQYEKHLDSNLITSIPAEKWARKVIQAIENENEDVRPVGMTRLGLLLCRHFPRTFESLIASRFHR